MRTTAPKVLRLVITTESATSARAIMATTLLAVPPGQHPTRISPTARGAFNRSSAAIAAAKAGIEGLVRSAAAGYAGAFTLLAIAVFVYMLIAIFPLPETKGRKLEEIETYFLGSACGR